jgi:hypothetical protein
VEWSDCKQHIGVVMTCPSVENDFSFEVIIGGGHGEDLCIKCEVVGQVTEFTNNNTYRPELAEEWARSRAELQIKRDRTSSSPVVKWINSSPIGFENSVRYNNRHSTQRHTTLEQNNKDNPNSSI